MKNTKATGWLRWFLMSYSKKHAFVYILHFEEALSHARHYTGWCISPEARFKDHATGNGSHLTKAFYNKGLGFEVGLLYRYSSNQEARSVEWHIKHRLKKVLRYCSRCSTYPVPLPMGHGTPMQWP